MCEFSIYGIFPKDNKKLLAYRNHQKWPLFDENVPKAVGLPKWPKQPFFDQIIVWAKLKAIVLLFWHKMTHFSVQNRGYLYKTKICLNIFEKKTIFHANQMHIIKFTGRRIWWPVPTKTKGYSVQLYGYVKSPEQKVTFSLHY